MSRKDLEEGMSEGLRLLGAGYTTVSSVSDAVKCLDSAIKAYTLRTPDFQNMGMAAMGAAMGAVMSILEAGGMPLGSLPNFQEALEDMHQSIHRLLVATRQALTGDE